MARVPMQCFSSVPNNSPHLATHSDLCLLIMGLALPWLDSVSLRPPRGLAHSRMEDRPGKRRGTRMAASEGTIKELGLTGASPGHTAAVGRAWAGLEPRPLGPSKPLL